MSKFSTNGKWCENTHDQAGNRSSVLEADGTTHAYGYDAKYQLTDWMRKNGKGKKEYHFKYTYDAAGNRTRLQKQTFGKAKSSVATSGRRGNNPKADDWWDHPSHSYAYDAANQLTEIGLGESAGKGKSWAVRFEYDANGNQIAKTDRNGKTTFEYDYNNMIKHITFPDSNENTYHNSTEGLKRPVKIDSTGYVGNFYDDYQGVEHILWEYDEQGQPKTRYTLGPRPDEIISRTTSDGTTSYYHYDGLGSVVALTDENGNVLGRYEYAPFGKMLSQPEGIDNKFTFQGREYDQDSGLYYYRTRYLDPEIGRFISRDPIG
ncbi:MAG: hypothetical protein KKG68_11745, partial [Verrucomicrobia bacterium]|nr:hypothetical protein [Verrucomicrobiota bacterium]